MLFPQKCAGCKKTSTILCSRCLSLIPRAKPSEQKFIYSLYDYQNPIVKNIVWLLKYKSRRNAAYCFSKEMLNELISILNKKTLIPGQTKPLLVPIPLHKNRMLERGYNQSELLAKAIKKCDQENIFDLAPTILFRNKETPPQARSEKRSERILNLNNAFICKRPELVRGKIIILIDDVTTTGATLASAKKELLKAKPCAILAFTVAH